MDSVRHPTTLAIAPGGSSEVDKPHWAELAGPIQPAPADGTEYRVRYRRLHPGGGVRQWRATGMAGLCLAVEVLFVVWLLQAGHFPHLTGPTVLDVANVAVSVSIAIMEILRLVNVISLAVASITIRDPVPVTADPTLRVAFATTIVPAKEPLEVVRATLAAARRITHAGPLDVWLLDEGDDAAVKAMCDELGVRHFSRKGVEKWNQPSGPFKGKSKHGNYNAWLDAHGDEYDILASVDPDHVPVANYLERVLGYFRDPDVAFVVGPQVYANCDNFVTLAAESQQFPFHSIIQRAANRAGCAMLVGTNNALRIDALRSIGGLRDSITEDMATGLMFHTRRSAATGRRWTSVYTPDVLAHGEGPNAWTDYFSQQLRWSRGTFEVLRHDIPRMFWRLSPRQMSHYSLILTFYPSMAVAWILGAVNSALYVTFAASGIHVSVTVWLALYADATALQLLLYVSGRRHNVSPYETDGSPGLSGMLMSVLASPLFASGLVATVLGRPANFAVTPKGSSASGDQWLTFRRHLRWATFFGAALAASVAVDHVSPMVCFWPLIALVVCITPIVLWRLDQHRNRRAERARSALNPVPEPAGQSLITAPAPRLELEAS